MFFLFRKRLIDYIEIIEEYDTNVNWQKLALMKISVENVKWYLIVFVLHHWIFIGCRIALFLFIQIFCCGCQCIDDEANERVLKDEHGNEIEVGDASINYFYEYDKMENDAYCNYILSYNYEEFMEKNHRISGRGWAEEARNEIEMNRMRRGESFR